MDTIVKMFKSVNPTLSIIIPAYNCEMYIRQTIDSCLRQDWEDIEIIIIDDGSTDGTAQIVDSYVSHPKIIVAHQINQGVSAARNYGISISTGEYITFLDGDDTLRNGTLGKNMELLIDHQDVDWLMFPIQRINMFGDRVNRISDSHLPSYNYQTQRIIEPVEMYLEIQENKLPTSIWASIFKKSFLDCPFPICRFEDAIMIMRLLCKHCKILISPFGEYEYYDREGSFINSKWDFQKWNSYTNMMIAKIHTRQLLLPSEKKKLEQIKASYYYTLRSLAEIYSDNLDYKTLLNFYTDQIGVTKFLIIGWTKYRFRVIWNKWKKFVKLVKIY